MQITPLKFYDQTFKGRFVLKLPPQRLAEIQELEGAYDSLTLKLAKQNGPTRTKFRSLFPGLYTGDRTKGFNLFEGDNPVNAQFHLYKFSAKAPLTMRVYEGTDKNFLVSCSCGKGSDELVVESTEQYDAELLKGGVDIKDKISQFAASMKNEFKLLLDYSEEYMNIKSFITPDTPKSQIAKLIEIERKKQVPFPSDEFKQEIDALLKGFEELKTKLDYRKSAFQIKQAYYQEGQIIEEKGLRFYDNNGAFAVYTPLHSADDDRIFRIQAFDTKGVLKKAVIAFEEGTFATLKDMSKPHDMRPSNLTKLTSNELSTLDIKKELDFISDSFSNFSGFIDEYIKTHKFVVVNGKYEIKDLQEYAAEKEAAKLAREKAKKLQKEKIALAKLNAKNERLRLRLDKQAQIKAEKAARAANRRKEKELAKKEALERKQVQPNKVKQVPKIFTKQILQDAVSQIQEIFMQPVELRDSRFSHERLKDGRIFGGKIFVTTKDGTKISVTRVKSPRYVDFEYYSIKVESPERVSVMNIDSYDGGIIRSSDEGKPILIGAQVSYMPMSEYASTSEIATKMPYYLDQLLNGDVKKGRIVNTELKMKKIVTPEEILNAELPPLDNY